jgi:HPt (histidine-containing phosphotransfer) domain-containing protein
MTVPADFAQLAEDLAPEDVRRVLDVFEADVRRLVGNLKAAAAAGDVNAFKRVAHGLAGAAGAVGTKSLELACRDAMVRRDLAVASLAATSGAIERLAEEALGDLSAFVAGLEVSAGRG